MKPWQPLHNFFHGYILAFTTESKEPFIKAEYSMEADVILLLAKWFFPTFYFVWTIPRNFPFRILSEAFKRSQGKASQKTWC